MLTNDKETSSALLFVSIFIIARLGVLLKSAEKIPPKLFIGEVLIAIALAFASWHFGLMQGMSFSQTVVYGVGASLGHIHIFKFIAQQTVKRGH
ncbi:hypothetical protein J0J26_20585 [Vibrio vulnificus]|uniref:hypothetical protein n=1 Tax=Vibrio TaxID=662 RepID=UPI00192FA641|nr:MULTISPECIES: hypothetical protein [Vibrio]EHZ7344534.1 hypothetical protein [Vibrio vulnificus]MBE3670944.1 hypothetical protein [Vibrio navarrensis]MBN8090484.1 hypothetical protein [Vibrio vulnificus]MBN8119331.1 hypothetical protein [Vibrio vulnificus]